MPLSSFSDNYAMYDVTPVENLFLLEYMPYAPGDYVRVYLYGLMQCRHPSESASLESLARTLRLREEQVLEAFRYWEQKGLVVGVSDQPPTFQYVNVRTAMMTEGGGQEQTQAYRYRDFNNELQALAGELLRPQQYAMAMEWVEDLNIPPDVVLEMVRGTSERLTQINRGKRRSAAYLFKVLAETALDWAKRDIRTLEAARAELDKGKRKYRVAQQVLRALGQQRNPTRVETALAAKWLEEWQYDENDIEAALQKTAASANPSFAYLDGILSRYREGGGVLEDRMERVDKPREAVRALLQQLGAAQSTPAPQQLQRYAEWLEEGFEPEAVLRAAALCGRRGRNRFEDLEMMLARWRELNLTRDVDVERYLRRYAELRALAGRIFERAGLDRRATEADLDKIGLWRERQSEELLLYAAECSRDAKSPMAFMEKLLNDWAGKGVADVAAAQQEKEARRARTHAEKPRTQTPPQPLPAQQYAQRDYDDSFFDSFFVDLTGKEDSKP